MAVELRPLGVQCNIACQYCYQNPQRDAGNMRERYDMEAMKAAIQREGGPFTMFGGEPLLMPEADLEELWAWGKEQYGQNTVQTNGVLINENHYRMFREYNVGVGISLDGPGELNDVRWAGTLEKTREATRKAEQAIERLCSEGMPPCLIVTLHKGNATADKLPVLMDWMRHLDAIGIQHARIHLLEVESAEIRNKYALSIAENIEALEYLQRLECELQQLQFDLFEDMKNLLSANDATATCVWRACDPNTTAAVRGVEGHGESSNCGRTNKDGVDYIKSDSAGYERYLALYHTPQEFGGCQGCRFFLACKGQCPGTAIDGDWRNRTEHCGVWKWMFRIAEERLLDAGEFPLSVQPNRKYLEAEMLAAWAAGSNPTLQDTIANMWTKPEASVT